MLEFRHHRCVHWNAQSHVVIREKALVAGAHIPEIPPLKGKCHFAVWGRSPFSGGKKGEE